MYYGKTRSKMIVTSRREAEGVIFNDFNKIFEKYLKIKKQNNMMSGKQMYQFFLSK